MTDKLDLSGWRQLDEAGRRRVIEKLRPVMAEIADELGARNRRERRDVLEAVGLSSLAEAGWAVIAARTDNGDPRRYL